MYSIYVTVYHLDYNLPPSGNITAILGKGINEITKYKTDILGIVPGKCDLTNSDSCGYAQALESMDDTVSFAVAHNVGSRVDKIYYSLPTITSKSNMDEFTKTIYAYVTNAINRINSKSVHQYPLSNPYYRNTVNKLGNDLHHITAIADELADKSNDVDDAAKRMLSSGNMLATYTTHI
jgi:hypothetical protein